MFLPGSVISLCPNLPVKWYPCFSLLCLCVWRHVTSSLQLAYNYFNLHGAILLFIAFLIFGNLLVLVFNGLFAYFSMMCILTTSVMFTVLCLYVRKFICLAVCANQVVQFVKFSAFSCEILDLSHAE